MITDVATKLQDVIDGINHVLHPDAPVTKRDLVDIAHQIEGVIGEISKILTPGKILLAVCDRHLKPSLQWTLVVIAHRIDGIIRDINEMITMCTFFK